MRGKPKKKPNVTLVLTPKKKPNVTLVITPKKPKKYPTRPKRYA